MVALNSALAVDLTARSRPTRSGRASSRASVPGGLHPGSARSKGGKPIIALPSTAKGGEISRIVPVLAEGAGVVTSRGDIHYVVTEYGAVTCGQEHPPENGSPHRDRAPGLRGDLLSSAKARKYCSCPRNLS